MKDALKKAIANTQQVQQVQVKLYQNLSQTTTLQQQLYQQAEKALETYPSNPVDTPTKDAPETHQQQEVLQLLEYEAQVLQEKLAKKPAKEIVSAFDAELRAYIRELTYEESDISNKTYTLIDITREIHQRFDTLKRIQQAIPHYRVALGLYEEIMYLAQESYPGTSVDPRGRGFIKGITWRNHVRTQIVEFAVPEVLAVLNELETIFRGLKSLAYIPLTGLRSRHTSISTYRSEFSLNAVTDRIAKIMRLTAQYLTQFRTDLAILLEYQPKLLDDIHQLIQQQQDIITNLLNYEQNK